MSSTARSEPGLGKTELLEWASSRTGSKLDSLEFLRSGNVFLQVLHLVLLITQCGLLQLLHRENPKAVIDTSQIVPNPATKRDVLQNYTLLNQSLDLWSGGHREPSLHTAH